MAQSATLKRPDPPAPPRRSPRAGRRRGRARRAWVVPPWLLTWRGELLVVAAVVALGLAVRLPYLQLVPHYTDELIEVINAVGIARGEKFPLTAKDLYFGPVHYYILAGFIRVFGLSAGLPRLVIMFFGLLAVVATYFLGRALAGRAVAALGAALLATSAQHIIVNSHVAWQNSTMPLYTTLSFLGFVVALNRLAPAPGAAPAPVAPRRLAAPLILAGLCFGLALQTHPGAIVLAPALLAAFFLALRRRRAWAVLRSPWPYAATAAALLAYAPPLLFNLLNGLPGYDRVINRRNYAYEMRPSLGSYLANLRDLLYELVRTISDPTRLPAEPWGYLTSPYAVFATVAAVAGLVLLARRGQPLPLLATLATIAIMPRYLRAYGPGSDYIMLFGRYVGYLLPLLYIAVAAAVVAGLRWAWRRVADRRAGASGRRPDLVRAFAAPLAAVAVAAIVLWPLQPLPGFYRETLAIDPNNVSYGATARAVADLRAPQTPVVVDNYLLKVFNKEGLTALDAIRYHLDIVGVTYRAVDDPEAELRRLIPTIDPNDPATWPLVVTMRDRCWPLRDRVPLQRASERFRLRDFYPGLPTYYAVYRYTPTGPNPGCFGPEGAQPGD